MSSEDVTVWLARLDSPALRVQQLAHCLIVEERLKAEGFHFKRDRRQFIIRRGVLRIILGRYLHIEPSRVQFSHGPHGKTYLAERLGDGTLRFNLSHLHKLALYVFTRGREIGADVEYLRTMPDAGQFAARFFSARENVTIQTLPASQRQTASFDCWTRKEAYIKALGIGLSQALDQFDVSLIPGEPAHLVDVEIGCDEPSRWSFSALTPTPGYVAALAIRGFNRHPAFWQFSEPPSEGDQSYHTLRVR